MAHYLNIYNYEEIIEQTSPKEVTVTFDYSF